MIDFGQEGYSSDKVEKLLKGNRNVHYEFSIQDSHGKTLGWLSNVTASISYDSSREIMRTASFRIKKNELMDINRLDDRVIPWMVLTIGKDSLRWPLGKFVINPTESYNSGGIYYPCEGYDQAIILSTDLLDDVLWFNYGSNYINQVTDLIGTSLTDYEIEAYPEGTTYNRTGMEFDIGTPKIQVANEILSAVNYYPIHFDERGKALSKHYEFPNLRQTDFAYSTGKQSVIKNGISRSMNVFEMANRFIRYTENTEDTTYFRSVYENTNPESPLSIQNRGRIITDIESVSNICSASELDAYTKRIATQKTEVYEQIEFKTCNMPMHGYKNIIFFECKEAEIAGKYVETAWQMDLRTGGDMTHKCNRMVVI